MNRIQSGFRSPFLVLLVLFCFQNCDPYSAGELSSNDLPFAYSVKIDTIANMTCSRQYSAKGPDSNVFTYRVGAFVAGSGLAFTPEFRQGTLNKSVSQKVDALSDSAVNGHTRLELSIRTRHLDGAMQIQEAGNFQIGVDSATYAPNLSDPALVSMLSVANGAYVNQFPSAYPQTIDLKLSQNGILENVSQETRDNLAGFGARPTYLTIAYSDSLDAMEQALRADPAANRKFFGTGYSLGFTGGGAHRQLTSIQEVDLKTGSPVISGWTCYQFQIRPPSNCAGTGTCPADPAQGATGIMAAAVRRVLPKTDWIIGLDGNILVVAPIVGGDNCYDNEYNRPILWYASNCQEDPNPTTGNLCPHYFNLCVRN